ncbi:MAG: hypothetical protein ACREBC_21130, partial [Pyrinomonadaceae bacterium]
MKIITDDRFKQPKNSSDLIGEPLVLHKRPGKENRNLIIFVHGLGGDRYSTWKKFPRFLYEDLPDADIGLYWYRTAWHRLRITASVALDQEATVMADVVRSCTQYSTNPSENSTDPYNAIAFIAHSMGGILAKAAIKSLIDRDERHTLGRICALFLMATPQAGSLRSSRLFSWLSHDLKALQPHGRLVTQIAETFNDRVQSHGRPDRSNRFLVPIFTVLAAEDLWVDSLTGGLTLSTEQRHMVKGPHTQIVKPRSKTDNAYAWVFHRLKGCFETHQQRLKSIVVQAPLRGGPTLILPEEERSYEPENAQWLRFWHRGSYFVGRDAELQELAQFYMSDVPFRWYAIVGAGGLGKSHLARESLRRLPSSWQKGFLKGGVREFADLIPLWTPESAVAIVIDYAARDPDSLVMLIDALCGNASRFHRSVRVLLLERKAKDQFWTLSTTSEPRRNIATGTESGGPA